MGSSRPFFRDRQPSRRNENSRLLEIKSKTIVSKTMVFIFIAKDWNEKKQLLVIGGTVCIGLNIM